MQLFLSTFLVLFLSHNLLSFADIKSINQKPITSSITTRTHLTLRDFTGRSENHGVTTHVILRLRNEREEGKRGTFVHSHGRMFSRPLFIPDFRRYVCAPAPDSLTSHICTHQTTYDMIRDEERLMTKEITSKRN